MLQEAVQGFGFGFDFGFDFDFAVIETEIADTRMDHRLPGN